jgi:hypothetical protein
MCNPKWAINICLHTRRRNGRPKIRLRSLADCHHDFARLVPQVCLAAFGVFRNSRLVAAQSSMLATFTRLRSSSNGFLD